MARETGRVLQPLYPFTSPSARPLRMASGTYPGQSSLSTELAVSLGMAACRPDFTKQLPLYVRTQTLAGPYMAFP